ncbi:MAG: Type 1 glutamine amidotransferase-like domain-containing protein [Acidimicrobiales bacterium]|jgi:cyanophycinase-like exopeptidase
MPGPVALVGSGEYLAVMAELEAALIAGRPSRYVQLATAAGMEGPGSIDRWTALGAAQAARLGVEAVPVKALDRESAEDAANAEQVRGAGLIYLSGGNPSYLADTLRETLVWAAIVEEWLKGAALAGCSAGAMALTGWVPNIRRPEAEPRAGLGTVPKLWVLPHFDRLKEWAPRTAEVVAAQVPAGMTLIGIDEETAIVSDGNDLSRWVVHGRQSVWVSGPDGWESFRAGAEVRV